MKLQNPVQNSHFPLSHWRQNECFYIVASHGLELCKLAGPFSRITHALPWLQPAKTCAIELDCEAALYDYGVIRMQNGYKSGALNHILGIVLQD